MNQAPPYRQHHPRWYRERISTYWWLGKWPYLKFVLRELSSVAVALTVVMTLIQVWALRAGREFYAAFEQAVRAPLVVALAAVSFAFVLLHAITWFNLAPTAMVLRVGGKRVPDFVIAGANYAAWLVATAVVAWFILRG
jgi:fumarate reductase subunit C